MAAIPTTSPTMDAKATELPKTEEVVDFNNLPCPLPYEEIHRESLSIVNSLLIYVFFIDLAFDWCVLGQKLGLIY